MQKFDVFYSELKNNPNRTDELKLKLLRSLLVINKNYRGMKKYADHNYLYKAGSRNGGNLEIPSLCNAPEAVISRTPAIKSSRAFSFFSKKKICNSQ